MRMPSRTVIRATAKAGNQPACMAAIPTSSSWTKAAAVAYTMNPISMPGLMWVAMPVPRVSSRAMTR